MGDGRGAPGVVVVGSVHTDFVTSADRLPGRGETLPGHRFGEFPGGKGDNQAIAVARAGARSRLLGRVGRDAQGQRLRAALAAKGVDVAWLGEDPEAGTGASAVLVGAEGDYASIVVPGASARLSSADVARARPAFAASRVVVGQLEIAPAVTLAALSLGGRLGSITVLNAPPAPTDPASLPSGLWRAVNVVVVNRVEAAMLLRRHPGSPADGERDALDLARGFGLRSAVVTLGETGTAVASDGATWREAGFRVDALDAIGAGDAFVGFLVASLAAGADLTAAVRRANAAGALAVTRSGAYDAAPTAAEVEALLASASR